MNMTNNITNPHDSVYLIPKLGFEFNTANNKLVIETSSSIFLFAYNYNWDNRRYINLVMETLSYLGEVVYVRVRNIQQLHQVDKVMIVVKNTYDSIRNEKRRKWQ